MKREDALAHIEFEVEILNILIKNSEDVLVQLRKVNRSSHESRRKLVESLIAAHEEQLHKINTKRRIVCDLYDTLLLEDDNEDVQEITFQ